MHTDEVISPVKDLVRAQLNQVCEFIVSIPLSSLIEIANIIDTSRQKGGEVIIFGNGGSAATALHMANDFLALYQGSEAPLKVSCLNANMSTFSAIANDFGYEHVFSHQLAGRINEKSVLIGISASGNSPNCVNAFSVAQQMGAYTIGLLGFDGGKMRAMCNSFIHIPVKDYYIVENLHMILSHSLSYILKSLPQN